MLLNGENIISFLSTANLLQLKEALYIDFIKPFINKKNIFAFLRLSTVSSQRNLRKYLLSLIKHSFVSLSKTIEFNAIDYTFLTFIIQSSDLNVSSEIEVFEAVVSWIQYDEKSRKKFMCDLLKVVRLPLLSPEVLEHVIKKNPFCYNCPKCCEHIDFIQNDKRNKSSLKSVQSQNRCCGNEYVSFMFINGFTREEYLCTKLKDDFKFKKLCEAQRAQNFYKTVYCLDHYRDKYKYFSYATERRPSLFSVNTKQWVDIFSGINGYNENRRS